MPRVPIPEGKMKLKVNRDKARWTGQEPDLLGYSFTWHQKVKIRVPKKHA